MCSAPDIPYMNGTHVSHLDPAGMDVTLGTISLLSRGLLCICSFLAGKHHVAHAIWLYVLNRIMLFSSQTHGCTIPVRLLYRNLQAYTMHHELTPCHLTPPVQAMPKTPFLRSACSGYVPSHTSKARPFYAVSCTRHQRGRNSSAVHTRMAISLRCRARVHLT